MGFTGLARAKNCPVKPVENHPTQFAQGMNAWLKENAAKVSMDDIICCLPEVYKSNYIVAHSSISAQMSHYHSPRVILFDAQNSVFLSISGGDPSLPQGTNVEIMQTGPNRHLELFDLDHEKPGVTEKNPGKCIACHGGTGTDVAGTHPNFDPIAVWPRFMRGMASIDCRDSSSTKAVDEAAEKSLANPRFQCLDKGQASGQQMTGHLFAFDQTMARLNAQRTARLLKATPDYERFKYLFMGINFCRRERGKVKPFPIREWIPEKVLSQMTDTKLITARVRNTSPENAVATALAEEFKSEARIAKVLKRISDMGASKDAPGFEAYTGVARCQDPEKFPQQLNALLKAQYQNHPVVDKYITDTVLRGTGVRTSLDRPPSDLGSLQSIDPILRFALESRGIPADNLDMQATSGTYVRDLNPVSVLTNALYELEPADSPMKKFGRLKNFSDLDPSICAQLKAMSMKALSQNAPSRSDDKPANPKVTR